MVTTFFNDVLWMIFGNSTWFKDVQSIRTIRCVFMVDLGKLNKKEGCFDEVV